MDSMDSVQLSMDSTVSMDSMKNVHGFHEKCPWIPWKMSRMSMDYGIHGLSTDCRYILHGYVFLMDRHQARHFWLAKQFCLSGGGGKPGQFSTAL